MPTANRAALLPIQRDLRAAGNPAHATALLRFYRTGPGEYGEGDRFLALTVPTTRALVKRWRADLGLGDASTLLGACRRIPLLRPMPGVPRRASDGDAQASRRSLRESGILSLRPNCSAEVHSTG